MVGSSTGNESMMLVAEVMVISCFLKEIHFCCAAFEISALVTLGERWLILTPVVVLPMAWYIFKHFHLQISITMCAFLKLGILKRPSCSLESVAVPSASSFGCFTS